MRRVGVFGGSFSPPHIGHVAAARQFLTACTLDRLLIVPTALPPHKETRNLPCGEHRLALCRLAFGELPKTEICDIEIRRGGKSYTYLTLRELSCPDTELFFLCGADMLFSLDRWMQPSELFSLAHFVAVLRSDDPLEKARMLAQRDALTLRFGAKISLLFGDPITLSSTEIRAALAEGRDASFALSPSVTEYIERWKLYR